MGFLSAYDGDETVAIPHPDPSKNYWVKLRRYLSHGSTEKAALALQEMEMVAGKPQPAPNLRKHQDERVHAAILDWNLDDDNGVIWPINMQSIRRLPDEVFDLLHTRVEELNRPRTPKEQAQFPAADSGGDPASGDAGAAGAVDVPGGEGAVAAAGPEA